jgi:hypothetical protein
MWKSSNCMWVFILFLNCGLVLELILIVTKIRKHPFFFVGDF